MKLYFGNAVATTTILMILALLDFIGWSAWVTSTETPRLLSCCSALRSAALRRRGTG